jgi:hypothetical protein
MALKGAPNLPQSQCLAYTYWHAQPEEEYLIIQKMKELSEEN